MANRYEISPPSGIYISEITLPNDVVIYAATNEGRQPRSLRVNWSDSVNVRAQLHGDSSIGDSMTAFWVLEPTSQAVQILTLRKIRSDFHTAACIKCDLISEEESYLQEERLYSTKKWTEWELVLEVNARKPKGPPLVSSADAASLTDTDFLTILTLAPDLKLKDGFLVFPDGRTLAIGGAIRDVNGLIRFADGSVLHPNGDLTFADETHCNIFHLGVVANGGPGAGEFEWTLDARFPPGTIKMKDGYHLPNGMIVTDDCVRLPDGCIKWKDDPRLQMPDGSWQDPKPDGCYAEPTCVSRYRNQQKPCRQDHLRVVR